LNSDTSLHANTDGNQGYPEVSLKRARQKRDDARRQLSNGVDPTLKRRAEADSAINTFKAVTDEWLLTKKHALTAATRVRDRRQIYKWVIPYLGSKPIAAIEAPDLLAVLKKIEAKQGRDRDRNLLNTYASVQEIERLRDQRMTLVSDQIKVASQFLDLSRGKLKKLRDSSMHYKPYSADPKAPAMPDQIAEDLVRMGNDMRTQEQNLREKRSEETTMNKQFESDIARFKELKGIH